MESTSGLFGVSFQQVLRKGQARAVEASLEEFRTRLNVQLPTGYGKTATAFSIYSVLQHKGKVNRLLYIVPTSAQLEQIAKDGKSDLMMADVSGSRCICDVGYSSTTALKQHRTNKSQVFVCTVQALTNHRGIIWETVKEMMETGRWMGCIDEYHHYGIDAHWGKLVSQLNFGFRLAMSATPYRKEDDSAFGDPDIVVSYREAVSEKAVKPLECHSYVYRIDAIGPDGSVHTYTTDELINEAGSDSPDAIEKLRIEKQMRWSPKYVSPLVDRPIARMMRERIRTGYPLQALIGAMSCSHAEMVCDQIRAMYPELRVDWVGTGINGRQDKENSEVLSRFCPPKVDGQRRPQDIKTDVLVHVAMAGEGLDSIYVSEVVHLNPANINNTNHQENGRAARFLPEVRGYINVDSSSQYAEFVGESIMDVLDNPYAEPPEKPDENLHPDDETEWEPLPENPKIHIYDMECIRIDEGEVRRYAGAMAAAMSGLNPSVMSDPNHPLWGLIDGNHDHPVWRLSEAGYRNMRKQEAELFNERSVIEQWLEKVSGALSRVTSLILRKKYGDSRYEKGAPGDIKRAINTRKKREIGGIDKDVDIAKRHYHWLADLEAAILKSGIPSWLA